MGAPPHTRRSFLGLAGGSALLCTIGGETVQVDSPRALARADALAASVARPPAAHARSAAFPEIQPAPGGRRREFWIQAESHRWNVIPTGKDDWEHMRIPRRHRFDAMVYREMTEGFAKPKYGITIPGPTLYAEVGDVIAVHFRNAMTKRDQPVTMHPHGVRYNPEYDGAYMGRYTRAGGFIAPGEEFTYQWECGPDSIGAWPYHDHGPNHVLNAMRGLFGAIVVRPRGAKWPDRSYSLFLHSFPPNVTGLDANFQCINGRSFAGNTPTLTSRVGEDVEFNVFGMDNFFHTFHVHGHRWRDGAGTPVDNPTVGPNETVIARFNEDNPGRWLYHCHVFSHQMAGMAGWYDVTE
jgi:FtsP/CotA-like multicopper oxidase with cupredoxin domain